MEVLGTGLEQCGTLAESGGGKTGKNKQNALEAGTQTSAMESFLLGGLVEADL